MLEFFRFESEKSAPLSVDSEKFIPLALAPEKLSPGKLLFFCSFFAFRETSFLNSSKIIPVMFAPYVSALSSSVPESFTFSRLAYFKFAFIRLAFLKSAPVKSAPSKLEANRFADLKLIPLKS